MQETKLPRLVYVPDDPDPFDPPDYKYGIEPESNNYFKVEKNVRLELVKAGIDFRLAHQLAIIIVGKNDPTNFSRDTQECLAKVLYLDLDDIDSHAISTCIELHNVGLLEPTVRPIFPEAIRRNWWQYRLSQTFKRLRGMFQKS